MATKKTVLQTLAIHLSSTTHLIHTWNCRQMTSYFSQEIPRVVQSVSINASTDEALEVPPSGNAILDSLQPASKAVYPLHTDTLELAKQIDKNGIPWLDFLPTEPMRLANSSAGGCRNLAIVGYGTLLWEWNRLKKILRSKIQAILSAAGESIHQRSTVAKDAIQIIITAAPGGTGMGRAIAIGEMSREIAAQMNVAVTLIFIKLRGDLFQSSSETRTRALVAANDIELLAAQSGYFNHRIGPPQAGKQRWGCDKVFDLVYHVGNLNTVAEMSHAPIRLNSLPQQLGMVSRFLFLTTCTPVGVMLNRRLNDTMADELTQSDPMGWRTDNMAFGLAELYLPRLPLLGVAHLYLIQEVFLRLHQPSPSAAEQLIEQGLALLHLTEQGARWTSHLTEGLIEKVETRIKGGGKRPLEARMVTYQRLLVDDIDLQIQSTARQFAIHIAGSLHDWLQTMITQSRDASDAIAQQSASATDEIKRFEENDFSFFVPVGKCLVREGAQRRDDIAAMLGRLTISETLEQTVDAIISTLGNQIPQPWQLATVQSLPSLLSAHCQKQLLTQLDVWEYFTNQFSIEDQNAYLHYAVSASAEYILTDRALMHNSESRICIVVAPQRAHKTLCQMLDEMPNALSFYPIDIGDTDRISFLTVRAGIPLSALKSVENNELELEAFLLSHPKEERVFTRPEWRFLPRICALYDAQDPLLGVYVLQGVCAEVLVHNDAFRYQLHRATWESKTPRRYPLLR